VEGTKTIRQQTERRWFVAVVKNLTEASCADGLEKMGFEVYVPTETRMFETSTGKRHERMRALISARLFIHATEAERLQAVNTPYIIHYMTDIAGHPDRWGRRPLAVIPDTQMQALQYMVFNASKPVSISEGALVRGDKVRVARGPLKGMEGVIARDPDGVSRIYITLDTFGCASTELDIESVERI
jgi:transcription antitermination factor NusG